MKRPLRLALFVLLAVLAAPLNSPGPAQAQDKDVARAQKAPEKTTAKPTTKNAASEKAKKAKAAKARAARTQAEKLQGERPKLTREELVKPYAGSTLYGPPAPPRSAADNATVREYDPAPKSRPFAKQEDSSPINFRIGAEKVVDPLTGKEVTPKPDAAGVKDSVKNMDIKGAMDKVGGKAEIQVDILKF